jgi:acyl-[acyl-carrier-protein]-phospholipid O-acyltransferase / long-chain-fatty-acid--[acyl-carrier-protein] ligase
MKPFIGKLKRFIVKTGVKACFKFSADAMARVPAEGPVVLGINSVSFVDAFLVQAALSRPALFLLEKTDCGYTRLAPLLALCNAVSVDFDDPSDVASAYEAAGRVLAGGGIVALFPEGRITRSGFLNPFDDRCARVAQQTGCPVVPLYIDLMRGSRNTVFGHASVQMEHGLRRHATVVCGAACDNRTSPETLRSSVEALSVRAYDLRRSHRRSLGYMMIRCARSGWFRNSIVDTTGKRFTSGAHLAASLVLAGVLKKRFAKESSVGVLLPATAGAALVNAGITLSGKIPVNLNFTTASENIVFAVNSCSIRTVITSRLFAKKMPNLTLPDAVRTVFLEDLASSVSAFGRFIALTKALFVPARVLVHERGIRPDDCATIVYSSGSSSNPKGIMLSHHNIISNLEQMHTVFDFSRDDCMCAALPFFHSFGLTVTLWFPLVAGFRVVYHPSPLDATVIVDIVKKQKATILPCTPTFLQAYMRRAEPEDFVSLRLIISGAEKLKTHFAQEFVGKFGVAPLEGYGATEMSPVASLNVPDVDLWGRREQGTKPGTIGRLVPGMSARIVDPDTGALREAGKSGLLLLKGPNIMKGYLGQPAKTAEAIVDGWYSTGDVAAISPDGFITLTDRLSRFSKIGGEMVPHAALEEILQCALGTSGEQIVAVTAVPDLRRGEKLVVLYTDAAGGAQGLRTIVEKAGVPNLWKPANDAYARVDEIPVLGTGKTDLKAVRVLALRAFPSGAA